MQLHATRFGFRFGLSSIALVVGSPTGSALDARKVTRRETAVTAIVRPQAI
jgi:hypothetical protein